MGWGFKHPPPHPNSIPPTMPPTPLMEGPPKVWGGEGYTPPPPTLPRASPPSRGAPGRGKRGGGLSALLFRGGSLAPTHRCGRPGRGAGGARGGGGGERWVGWSGSGERGGRERKGLPAWPPSAPAGCRMAQLYGRGASTPRHRPQICFPHPAMGNGHSSPPQGGYGQGVREEGGGGRHCGPGLGSGTSLGWGEFWGVCVPHPRVSGWGLECPLLRCVRLCGGTGGNGALLGVPLGLGLCGWGVSLGSRGGSFASPPGLVPNVDILGGTQLPLHPQNTPSSACSWRG